MYVREVHYITEQKQLISLIGLLESCVAAVECKGSVNFILRSDYVS